LVVDAVIVEAEIVAVAGLSSPALLSQARRSVLDRAAAQQSSALRNPDIRWRSRGDLRPLMGEVGPFQKSRTHLEGGAGGAA